MNIYFKEFRVTACKKLLIFASLIQFATFSKQFPENLSSMTLLLNLGSMRPVYCTFIFNMWAFLPSLNLDSPDKILVQIMYRRIFRQSASDAFHNVIFFPLFNQGD